MTAPQFFLVASPHVYAIGADGYFFGAYIDNDGIPDWSTSYDFNPQDEDVDHIVHMCHLLKQAQQLTQEHTSEVFVK